MRRKWARWLAGGVALAALLTLAAVWGLDRQALDRRRDLLGSVQYGCRLYAGDHGETMPPDLRALFPQYLPVPVFSAYAANDVEYYPGATGTSHPNTILLREKRPDRYSRRWVGTVDMSLVLVHSTP